MNVEREVPMFVLDVIVATTLAIPKLSKLEKRKKYTQVGYQMPKQLFINKTRMDKQEAPINIKLVHICNESN
jgi:hypothetical protein